MKVRTNPNQQYIVDLRLLVLETWFWVDHDTNEDEGFLSFAFFMVVVGKHFTFLLIVV